MTFYSLQPEVAGGWGEHTEADTTVHPPVVRRLHYVFDGWLGDDLLETFPCYIITRRLAARLRKSGLSGFEFRPVAVSRSETFRELNPGRSLPAFEWLYVAGRAGVEDFDISRGSLLIVSQAALGLLGRFALHHCNIAVWHA